MKLFYHHVGEKGANDDFPKTIYTRIPISVVDQTLPDRNLSKQSLLNQLKNNFPTSSFNCWGVPSQADIVIRNLKYGDAVLLVKSTNIQGEVPVLCKVKAFIPEEMRELSYAFWGNDKFPYIFFFDTQELNLLWIEFLDLLGYQENFDPRGRFYSVSDLKLKKFGGAEFFVNDTLKKWETGKSIYLSTEQVIEETLLEGDRNSIYITTHERSQIAREKCIHHYGVKCAVCRFDFEEEYGDIGKGFIHVHHLNSLANIDDVYEVDPIVDLIPICPNCHAMIHRRNPALSIDELRQLRSKG